VRSHLVSVKPGRPGATQQRCQHREQPLIQALPRLLSRDSSCGVWTAGLCARRPSFAARPALAPDGRRTHQPSHGIRVVQRQTSEHMHSLLAIPMVVILKAIQHLRSTDRRP